MTATLQPMPTDPPLRAAAVLPDLPSDADLLTITVYTVPPDVLVLAARGEVDLFSGPLLQDRLLAHLRPAGPQLVVVDLTDVHFLAAAGLTVLVAARQAAMAAGTRLSLVAHTRPVLLPLTITGLDGVFDIYPDLAHALPRPGSGPDG